MRKLRRRILRNVMPRSYLEMTSGGLARQAPPLIRLSKFQGKEHVVLNGNFTFRVTPVLLVENAFLSDYVGIPCCCDRFYRSVNGFHSFEQWFSRDPLCFRSM